MRNGRKALWGALICVFALVFSGCSGNAPAAEQNIKVQIDSLDTYSYRLTVKNKKNVLVANSYDNYVMDNKKRIKDSMQA